MAPTKKSKSTTSIRTSSKKAPAEITKASEAPKEETIVAKETAIPAAETTSKASETAAEKTPASESKSPTEKKSTGRTAKKTITKDSIRTTAKEAAAKASAKKAEVKEKASSAKKTVTEKATKAKATVAKLSASQETYFEIGGEQILMEEINERIRQAWLSEGHYAARLKSIKTYLNIEERRAYYVINGKAEDKYVEF